MKDNLTFGNIKWGAMVHSVIYQKTAYMKTGLHYICGMAQTYDGKTLKYQI
jgi:hypothetical protein